MAIATMNISLPDTMKLDIEEAVTQEGYGSVSELFRELARKYIRDRQRRLEKEKLEAVLLERLRDDNTVEFDLQQVKAELAKRLARKT